MAATLKAKAPRNYSIEQVSIITGLPMRTWRKMAGRAGFPPFTVEGIAPIFDADAIDAWLAAHRVKMASYPCRYEAGPYKDAERAAVVARQMNRYSVGAVAVEKSGKHFVFVPIPDGQAPADIADNLNALFPSVKWRLFDYLYDDAQPLAG